MKNSENECCPRFDPKPWDEKIFTWKNKRFIKDNVFTLFYIPLNYGQAMIRSVKKIEDGKASVIDGLVLSKSTSKWNMDLYLAVDRKVAGAKNITKSGRYLSKVYEGNFKDVGLWCQDFDDFVKKKKLKTKNTYMWYTTCPKCAKKYGKNYVVIIGEIK